MGKLMRSRFASSESGQVLVLTAILVVVIFGFTAFVVDVGRAYLVQRDLQAGVDAAALAGAQELPDPSLAAQVAHEYSPTAGKKNAIATVIDDAVTTVNVRCVQSAPGCSSPVRHVQRSRGECERERADRVREDLRHRHDGRRRQGARVLALCSEAARHHARPRSHGLHV